MDRQSSPAPSQPRPHFPSRQPSPSGQLWGMEELCDTQLLALLHCVGFGSGLP